ncbi:MAG: M28 family metallopeptidase [Thermoanaerobacteraceae bacterium]
MKSIDFLKDITQFKHRGSGTKNEMKAAEHILELLKNMGYIPKKQSFKTTRDNLYILPLQTAIILLISIIIPFIFQKNIYVFISFLLSILAIIPLLLEVSGISIETSIMPRFLSQNIFTSFDAEKRKKIILSAHYDTQRGSIMFHPKVVDYLNVIYNISYIGFGLIPLGLLSILIKLYVLGKIFIKLGFIIVAANIIFMAICEITGKYTQGANDNGTGVALTLALADYYIKNKDKFPENIDIIFLFTGSEETGERGMKNFIKKYGGYLPKDTQFIILDNLGAGKITYLEGEGMIFYKKAGEMLIDIADKMAEKYPKGNIQKMKNLLLPTDALPVLSGGFDAIAFLAKDENGRLGNYHWHTDTIENVDMKLLRYEEEFFKEYLKNVAESLSKR